jgi:hypothetical protein
MPRSRLSSKDYICTYPIFGDLPFRASDLEWLLLVAQTPRHADVLPWLAPQARLNHRAFQLKSTKSSYPTMESHRCCHRVALCGRTGMVIAPKLHLKSSNRGNHQQRTRYCNNGALSCEGKLFIAFLSACVVLKPLTDVAEGNVSKLNSHWSGDFAANPASMLLLSIRDGTTDIHVIVWLVSYFLFGSLLTPAARSCLGMKRLSRNQHCQARIHCTKYLPFHGICHGEVQGWFFLVIHETSILAPKVKSPKAELSIFDIPIYGIFRQKTSVWPFWSHTSALP